MENVCQDTSLFESVEIDEDSLYELLPPDERMMQTNVKKVQKSTQTSFVASASNIINNFESKLNNSVECKNESLHNISVYDSFSVESKYDSFEDSLNEGAHQKEINVSQFLSDQVTVRKTREKQKLRHLCDSLEDICSLVSNAEHFSASDNVENMNNIFEKHGIYDDSLRNDIYCDKRNTNSNEQYFDDDSLAIFEYEKTFDDSLEDANLASYVDSLIILRSSKGDAEVIGDKYNTENSCATKNVFESTVPVIYENRENPSISEDESFKTAENVSSAVNSKLISECHMSEDSLEEIGDISDHIPEVVVISDHLPEVDDISEHITDNGDISEHIPKIGDTSELIPKVGDSSEHIPDISNIFEKIPKIHISKEASHVPLEICDRNSVFLSENGIEISSLTKNDTKTKIQVDIVEIIFEDEIPQTTKTELQTGNIKKIPSLSPSVLEENRSVASITQNTSNSEQYNETNDSVLSGDQPSNKKCFSVADSTNTECKFRGLDLNYLAEHTGMKIVRVSDEFKKEQSKSLDDYPLVSSSSAQKEMSEGAFNYYNSSETCDKNESIHLKDGIMIGRIMSIDTKYVIQEDSTSLNINKEKNENLSYENSIGKINLPINNADTPSLSDQAAKTIKVIKCTGMMDGKITTTYLDASPILNAFDGQEMKFQLVDYDINSFKQCLDINLSKKDSERCHDLISVFPSKSEINVISSSQSNIISSDINNHTDTNGFPSSQVLNKNPETSTVHIPDKEGLKLCIAFSDKKLQNITVNVCLKDQVLENELYESAKTNVKAIDKKDTVKSVALKAQPIQNAHIAIKDESDVLDKIINEAQEKIPSFATSNAHKAEISVNNRNVTKCNTLIDLSIRNAHLIQALDLHDSSLPREERCLQSKDSIMPLNLCTKDKQSAEKASSFSLSDSKENIPVNLSEQVAMDTQKPKTPVKMKCNKLIGVDGDVKKSLCKSNSCTKIPVRKVESVLSTPSNRKIIRTEIKSNPCVGRGTKNTNKHISADLLKINAEESPKKTRHFCMVRNSISRVPKSSQKPKLKKFQDIESPVAKYIGSAKVTPLKATNCYDPNHVLDSFTSCGSNAKAASNACIMSAQKTSVTKTAKKFQS